MATYLTYTTLVADVQNYLERGGSAVTDPTVNAQIPRLINAAERKIMQFLRLQGVLEVLTDATSIVSGVNTISKPDRWRQTVSLSLSKGSGTPRFPLYPRSYEYCRYYWPSDTLTSQPKFYADYDLQHWLLAPSADAAYTLEALCYMQPVLLDAVNTTNFFTNYTPNLLLYGTLLEATPFLKDDARIPVWQTYWERELGSLANLDLQKILDRASERRSV